ncbi:RsmB/NOP family class I SAM-dependent RNA methyltransferase [Flavobacterium sp. ASW18X]|uniref:RsmB/NOP family class I SAM-dependent RNA methyltransferase n=1 Tax=Flavobacterium sp. ASW18X TaxID=2572595 RepID=UPI0010AE7BEB|nr:methyltransferase domain-containing protein [Flavobacterium sp. ASW18X]TKD60669.1 methyltransferase domain-containing protein [Flavobacterium sp. ASW18X]
MRLHRNLVFAVVDALGMIFNDEEYADKVIEKVLRYDKRWGARDRGFIAETTYEIVRYKRLYTAIAEVNEPFGREDLFRLFAVWAVLRGIPIPDWKQLDGTPVRRIKGRFDELSKTRKIRESYPDWIEERALAALGAKLWEKESRALNQQANVILRTNTLKVTRETLQQRLAEEEIETTLLENYPFALELVERKNVFTTQAFKEGLFEVQDASSQLVAPYLQVEPGHRVVDACAGAGGKTLHLASLMENKGQLIAMDIYESKLKKLKVRARRNGVHNMEPRVIENTKSIKKLHAKADRLLLDAPCSGLGVIRRNPDSKWKLEPEFLVRIKGVQQNILRNYSKMVKPGGKMVYATCSILPEENYDQVAAFLSSEEGAAFTFVKDKKVFASESGYDGFYMALLDKK